MECRNCKNLKNCKRQCMKLPNGMTCGDCINFDWCSMAYSVKPEYTSCDFEPIRFKYCTAGNLSYKVNGGMVCNVSGGKIVVGEFTCDNIATYNYDYCPHPEIGMDYDCGDSWWEIDDENLKSACLAEKEFRYYAFGREEMYGWHISDLKIYDTPKPLSAFKGLCKLDVGCGECPYYNYTKMECDGRTIKRPPQSWCYVEELK